MLSRVRTGEIAVDKNVSLARYVEDWLVDRAGLRRRESTVREYERCLVSYVLPSIGGVRLAALNTPMVESLFDRLAEAGLSHNSIRNVKKALSACMSDAVASRVLSTNLVRHARLPENARPPKPIVVPTSTEVRDLLESTQGTALGRLLVLLVSTGARVGEGLATKWSDLDLDAGTWVLAQTLTVNRAGQTVIGRRTKTGRVRSIRLTPAAVQALREQRVEIAANRLAALAWEDNDLVFPTAIGTVSDPHNKRRELKNHARKVGYETSFHGLRHYAATVAMANVSSTQVQQLLGHASHRTTTDVYGHLLQGPQETAANAIAESLGMQGFV
ncbi:MAG: site-specific integrase [Actinomycetota bacterium]|nr:site-specific integrase [Actinomycetota bacterium]